MPKRLALALTVAAVTCTTCGTPGHASPGPVTGGAIASASPEATAAGRTILEAGGNAVDAAVAIAFDLGVTEPAGSGLFAQAYLLVHRPGEQPFVIEGSTLAPAATPDDAEADDLRGRRASTVPSLVKVLQLAHARFGSGAVPWSALLAPAIADAERGFPLGPFRHHAIVGNAARLRADAACAQVFLRPDGSAPALGERIVQPALAATLRRLAEVGGEDFYHGEIAAEIARDMAANGGWITLADLQAFPEPRVGPALHGTYRDLDVYTLPPPTGGWVVLKALAELEKVSAQDLVDADRRTIAVAEALRTAHDLRLSTPIYGSTKGETTHFCVVDGAGTVVSATLSINDYFGARTMNRRLGVLYNDYMREFVLGQPDHPFALRAGAKPYSSMSATIVGKDGRPCLALGSPGGRRIISAVVQVLSNRVDRGMCLRDAVGSPRIHVVPEGDTLMLEPLSEPLGKTLLLELQRRGFAPAKPPASQFPGALAPYFGGVHAVCLEAPSAWSAAADPRRDGSAWATSLQ